MSIFTLACALDTQGEIRLGELLVNLSKFLSVQSQGFGFSDGCPPV